MRNSKIEARAAIMGRAGTQLAGMRQFSKARIVPRKHTPATPASKAVTAPPWEGRWNAFTVRKKAGFESVVKGHNSQSFPGLAGTNTVRLKCASSKATMTIIIYALLYTNHSQDI